MVFVSTVKYIRLSMYHLGSHLTEPKYGDYAKVKLTLIFEAFCKFIGKFGGKKKRLVLLTLY